MYNGGLCDKYLFGDPSWSFIGWKSEGMQVPKS